MITITLANKDNWETEVPSVRLKYPVDTHILYIQSMTASQYHYKLYQYLCDGCSDCERPRPASIQGCFAPDGDDDCDGTRVVLPKYSLIVMRSFADISDGGAVTPSMLDGMLQRAGCQIGFDSYGSMLDVLKAVTIDE